MKDHMQRVGRLALRREGSMWNAYYAQSDTMDGAVLLGSIAIAAVAGSQEREHAFVEMMKEIIAEALMERVGASPTFVREAMPERERKN